MVYVEKVGVVGAGAMGAAIAEVFALNGKKVVLKDIKQEFVDRGLKNVDASLSSLVTFHAAKAEREIERIETENGIRLTDEQKRQIREAKAPTYTQERVDRVRKAIKGTIDYADLADVDLVVEADHVRQLQGSHRPARARPHRLVDVARRRDAFLVEVERFGERAPEDAVHDEAGRLFDAHGEHRIAVVAQLLQE